jgi:hypothetical protein
MGQASKIGLLKLRVTGTLGILELAVRDELVDFAQSVGRLQQTKFRSPGDPPGALLESIGKTRLLISKHRKLGGGKQLDKSSACALGRFPNLAETAR